MTKQITTALITGALPGSVPSMPIAWPRAR